MKVGLLGFGTVGGGVGAIIRERQVQLQALLGEPIEIVAALVKDVSDFRGTAYEGIVTENPDLVVADPEIHVIFEALGGIDQPFEWISRALNNKKHVITANKAVVCAHFEQLMTLAADNGVSLSVEACVGGGIPIISTLKDHLLFGETTGIHGILNGTGNYILSKIEAESCPFEDALKEAQALGYAEQVPDDDVDGFDATRKLLILTALIHKGHYTIDQVWRSSIRGVAPLDFEVLKGEGKTLRYVVSCYRNPDQSLYLAARPCVVDCQSAYGQTFGPDNAIVFEHSHLNVLSLKGPGAGRYPTANAMVGDLVRLGRSLGETGAPIQARVPAEPPRLGQAPQKRYYVRSGSDYRYVETDAPAALMEALLKEDSRAFIAEVL